MTRGWQSVQRVSTLAWKEFIQLRRDWMMAAFTFTLPLLQLVLLAYATGTGIKELPMGILDGDQSAASRRLVEQLDALDTLRVTEDVADLDRLQLLLDRGELVLGVVIPSDLQADTQRRGGQAVVVLLADASNSAAGATALTAARQGVLDFVRREASHMGGPPPTIELRADVQYNVSLTSRAFTICAQVGFIVYQVALTVASVGLARERELGTLEVLIVMPLRRLELIAGKAIPAVLVAVVNFGLMLGVVVHGLGIPMRGSLGLLVGLTVLFSVAEVSYGLLISSVAGTQQQAILFVFVLAMLDMAFSGYLVRVENLPPVLRMVSRLVPLSHYLAIVRGIMLKGAGIGALWSHGLAIVGAGVLVMAVAGQTLERHAT